MKGSNRSDKLPDTWSGHLLSFLLPLIQVRQLSVAGETMCTKYCLGCLSLPRKSVFRLTDRSDMTLDVYRGRKTTTQQQQPFNTFASQTVFFEACLIAIILKSPALTIF